VGIEKYIAAASLGLFIMFVAEIITLYIFMIEPPRDVEPEPKILQFISIGVAPACVLAGTSFIMSKRYGSKPIGLMIIASGVILFVGMLMAQSLIDSIDQAYLISTVRITPPLFMGVSIPVIIFGVMLFRIKKQKPKKEYL
jgi:ABC-type transport system involved in multi-copper enzyme maturation permease subunit